MPSAPPITDRQLEYLQLLADGCTIEETGTRLGTSHRTAKAMAELLRRRLDVAKTRDLGRRARELGLV